MDRSSEEADPATPNYWFQDKYVQGSEHQTYWNNDYTLQRSYSVNQEWHLSQALAHFHTKLVSVEQDTREYEGSK
jgi:hypothetical protein